MRHRISSTLLYYIRVGLSRSDWYQYSDWGASDDCGEGVAVHDGTAFNVFFNLKFFESRIPIGCYSSLIRKYTTYSSEGVCTSFPFGICTYAPSKVRRAETVLYKCMERDADLHKLITTKGTVYYAGNGMILDSKFKPILIPYYNINMNTSVYSVSFVVSPSVFSNKSGLVEKYIVNHLIPWVESTKYVSSPNSINSTVPISVEISSTIEDCITVPVITSNNPTEEINTFLRDNLNTLNRQLWKQ